MTTDQLKRIASISVDELTAAFARGGYTYERRELRGTQLGDERCERQGHLEVRAGQPVFSFRFQDEDGRWENANAFVTLDAGGNLVAAH
jgi:hypothetical protein